MNNSNKTEDRKLKIDQFKRAFFMEFGTKVVIIEQPPVVTLINLEKVFNEYLYKLNKEYSKKYPKGIKTRKRNIELVNLRGCFNKIARDMGYSDIEVGIHLGLTHSTTFNSYKLIFKLLETRDIRTVFNMNKIYYELKERFGINADI